MTRTGIGRAGRQSSSASSRRRRRRSRRSGRRARRRRGTPSCRRSRCRSRRRARGRSRSTACRSSSSAATNAISSMCCCIARPQQVTAFQVRSLLPTAGRALRIDGDEALGLALLAHPRLPSRRSRRAAAAVEDETTGNGVARPRRARQVDLVAALDRADADVALDRLGARDDRPLQARRARQEAEPRRLAFIAASSASRCRPRPRC